MSSVRSNRPPKTSLQGKLVLLGATAGGIGYTPIFPGTVGTVAAIPFSFGLTRLAEVSVLGATIVLVFTIFSAIALATKASELLQQKDPGIIVIDEIVGFLLGNFSAPMTISALLCPSSCFAFSTSPRSSQHLGWSGFRGEPGLF